MKFTTNFTRLAKVLALLGLAGSMLYTIVGLLSGDAFFLVAGVSGLIGSTSLGVLSEISENLRNS